MDYIRKDPKIPKFPMEQRTFETRVKFIHDIFANKYAKEQIMASCINHKLDKSFEAYIKEIHQSLWVLYGKDPLAVLKKIDN